MDNNEIKLSKLQPGNKCKVVSLLCVGITRRRMLDLGLIPGSYVEAIRKSPLGGPIAYNIRGAIIALRKEESSQILVRLI
ncbi:MAG: ferrous iron transport protein A [Anaeromicrobium sp.]|jgi:ferrous iron transport protein A|uniref:FeoA family protein n=1 Tax=Anaeromicrobium sp. TaxID=1929132 RepID=UPI0025FB7647|nr:FeoA family protein [Anaeromicrobium sp.]MCT4595484.1 ferrous iron transport protein A [Anaeromicrobium sp.]